MSPCHRPRLVIAAFASLAAACAGPRRQAPKLADVVAPPLPSWLRPAVQRTIAPRRYDWQMVASRLLVGEGWGCAQTLPRRRAQGALADVPDDARPDDVVWQCWNARPAPAAAATREIPPLQARRVPWMDGDLLFRAGPDRVCSFGVDDLTFRCWQPPRPGDRTGTELAGTRTIIDRASSPMRGTPVERLVSTAAGGTFGCVLGPDHLWCLGDHRFGQDGAGASAANADKPPPVALAATSYLTQIGLGTWHACALTASFNPRGYVEWGSSCWGRNDGGQLGATAPDVCVVDGQNVPCSRTPLRGPVGNHWGPAARLLAGDLYTCVLENADPQGLLCWGASRDGLFGTASACPDALRRAWPTLHGPVSAPAVTCATSPARIAGEKPFIADPDQIRDLVAGPRGLCLSEMQAPDRVRCVGGIPTPESAALRTVHVSPGADASACAINDGAVVCWGDLYAPPTARHRLVTIALEPPAAIPPSQVITEQAIAREPAQPELYDDQCQVRRGCPLVPAALQPCAAGTQARPAANLLADAPALVGTVVRVRGPLGVGTIMSTAMGCTAASGKRACCNHVGGPVLLGGGQRPLGLEGLFCAGDDSQVCCNAPAYGQAVVASGRLERVGESDGLAGDPEWTLRDVRLCSEGPRVR